MAGARIEITFDDAEVRAALDRLLAPRTGRTPLMRDIGEHLLNTTRERFSAEKAPDGTPWAPLSELTKRRKKRNAGKVLTLSGILRGQLAYRAAPNHVAVGSPLLYAGTHQFGAQKGAFGATKRGAPIPFGNIPARPFLGLSPGDESEIRALVNDYLRDLIR